MTYNTTKISIIILNINMRWINLLNNCQIPYNIYKLNKNDSTIICKQYNNQNYLTIILHGSIYIIKIFENKKTIPIVILNKNSLFTTQDINNQFYYQLIALEKTYILTVKIDNVDKLSSELMIKIIESYRKTLNSYQMINESMNQKHKNNRVIQMILFLLFKLGIVSKTQIQLPFKVSQKNLAKITGTNKKTINQIINSIKRKSITNNSKKKSIKINSIFNFTEK
uniref:Global nitrogen transcriptional regulator n=1 Tax=Laurencia catarinensis TaxID=197326 RepID=UPI0028D2CF9C|nr:Global nitrogen transcriptional regulator [Laurencia catarinensis]WMP12564.1 Global nitrogen transcriptional regulator [Laurencia catarinensis]